VLLLVSLQNNIYDYWNTILKLPYSPEELNMMYSLFSRKKNTSKKNQECLLQEGQVCNKLYFVEQIVKGTICKKRQQKEVTQWFFEMVISCLA
jgi:hypothetical protein